MCGGISNARPRSFPETGFVQSDSACVCIPLPAPPPVQAPQQNSKEKVNKTYHFWKILFVLYLSLDNTQLYHA